MFKVLFARLEKRPIISFITIVAILFATIAFAHWLRSPKADLAMPEKTVKTSPLFVVGADGSHITVSGQVKKSGVTDIVALAPGVIKSIAVIPGQSIKAGQTLAVLTTDYGSGTTDIMKQQARLQTDFTERTFSLEKEIITLEREIANDDSAKSKDEEKAALKGLKLERERLNLGRENAALSLAIAERADAALRPKSLLSGTVEYVAVRPGDLVTTGTVLMTVRGAMQGASVEVTLPKATAVVLTHSGIALLETNNGMAALSQGYVGRGEDANGLIMATYPLPMNIAETLAQNSYVTLQLPLRSETERGFLIPIDTIRSAASSTSVIVMDENRKTQEVIVTLGETLGASVLVKNGLEKGMAIVLNASVLTGELIEPIR